jgi:arylsulfatase A-like enzyme
MIHVDQQRYDCLGFTGNSIVKTPNLDRLASQSVQFTSSFSPCPLCCPARQTLLSGVMPHVHGGHWNFDCASSIKGLSPEEFPHWPGLLKSHGYNMVYGGKWHVSQKYSPVDFSYDCEFDLDYYRHEHLKRIYGPALNTKEDAPVNLFDVGCIDTSNLEDTHTHQLTKRVLDCIDSQKDLDAPWHARIDFQEPHLPCHPVERFSSMYDPAQIEPWKNFEDHFAGKPHIQAEQLKNWGIENWKWKPWSEYMALYYGIISQVDDAVGRILAYLQDNDLIDDTLIIYTSDHGDAAGSHGMMDKHYVMYEEEIRTPLLFSWKNRIEPGICDSFVMNELDLGPTLLELANIPIPDSFQGNSLVPCLEDKEHTVRDIVYSEYNGQQFGLYTQRMVRDRKYKYIWNATDIDELYDLQEDPWELVNRVDDTRLEKIQKQLRRKLFTQFTASGDRIVTNPWMQYVLNQ